MTFEIRKWAECVSDEQKWIHHAEVAAWRIRRLGASYADHFTPIDPNGEWWNTHLVNQALDRIDEHDRCEIQRHGAADAANPDVAVQEEKYRRGAAWRAGNLDEYDAIHWPERLAERRRRGAASEPPITAADLGVTASPSDTGGLQHVADALPKRAAE